MSRASNIKSATFLPKAKVFGQCYNNDFPGVAVARPSDLCFCPLFERRITPSEWTE